MSVPYGLIVSWKSQTEVVFEWYWSNMIVELCYLTQKMMKWCNDAGLLRDSFFSVNSRWWNRNIRWWQAVDPDSGSIRLWRGRRLSLTFNEILTFNFHFAFVFLSSIFILTRSFHGFQDPILPFLSVSIHFYPFLDWLLCNRQQSSWKPALNSTPTCY